MKNKLGFTLIELLVVIAIIGLLSTLSIIALNGYIETEDNYKIKFGSSTYYVEDYVELAGDCVEFENKKVCGDYMIETLDKDN